MEPLSEQIGRLDHGPRWGEGEIDNGLLGLSKKVVEVRNVRSVTQ